MKKEFSKEKNNSNHYDTIIIGSGVGGLTSAICLARAGQKVLVLEQHDVPGGWCHSFYLNGYRFTPGVHYVGLMSPGESSNQLYAGLGIANDIGFYRMNPKGFDHCWIGDERFNYSANWEEFQQDLIDRFPHEKKGIIKYLRLVRNVGRQLELIPKVKGLWQQLTIPFRTKHMGKYSPFTLKRVINWHVKDPLLQNILNIQFGNHGLPPAKASFIMHAAIMCHYAEGGFYPMGGGGALVKAMTNKIKGYNGKVKTSATVKQILLEEGFKNKKAVGVALDSGEKIFADRVISNADPGITYLNLIGKDNLSTKLLKKLNKTTYSCTSLMLFLTVDMDVKKAGLDSGNIWRIPNQDMDASFADMQKKDILQGEEFSGMFISCTSLKDPISFDGRYHTLEAITYIHYDAFEKFKNETIARSPEYLAFKEQIINKFLVTLEKVVPGITSKIVHKDLGTPITNEYYINSTEGSVYGTEKSLRHIGPFAYKSKTEIENLYMCGASIAAHGVTGAGYSGVQTAAAILGCQQDDLLKEDKTQELRIFEAEDASNYPDWMLKKMEVKKQRLVKNDVFQNVDK
ncbi:NAD(P)/FAD-dependent oxidoreductase [Lacinutrix sp. C3R15]|uniref:phytoene desaturase family protein n=1 Tax=Flavobacteriaceae TaxID=49546 RepID=UPI001C09E461|nr:MULTISPECIES: NAD(P)/FAD-dependent oxidoreductase [Flavobacteriaceae]MBU2938689.1 NAD(P)/FAD-dependent oxidoreductase [Lacinutrix sp. C3R15]MDO6622003.1 NAD(P)/FAD-dependent oxidoreductase [Oceanihabitans sp. 1_MG-2023]